MGYDSLNPHNAYSWSSDSFSFHPACGMNEPRDCGTFGKWIHLSRLRSHLAVSTDRYWPKNCSSRHHRARRTPLSMVAQTLSISSIFVIPHIGGSLCQLWHSVGTSIGFSKLQSDPSNVPAVLSAPTSQTPMPTLVRNPLPTFPS